MRIPVNSLTYFNSKHGCALNNPLSHLQISAAELQINDLSFQLFKSPMKSDLGEDSSRAIGCYFHLFNPSAS